jgi:hypothetical protein
VVDHVHVTVKRLNVCANPPNIDIHHIDPTMLLRGLHISNPNGLKRVNMLPNLPKFTSSPSEDLTTHVEIFVEVLITSLVTNHDYYFIWFPSTFVNFAYV